MIYALDGVAPELPQEGSYYVAPDANLIGAVRLSEGASVWFGATIRADNEPVTIGPRS
ncbi:gamma carbonic anhydrase family protein, partial [Thioclava sp. BHET1]